MKKNTTIIITLIITYIMFWPATDILASGNDIRQGSAPGTEFKKIGSAGAQFLKIGIGARATGMGGAYSSVADDLTGLFWNPAGISDIEGIQASFAYTSWFAGFEHAFAAISLPVGENYVFAASLISFGTGDIDITTMAKPNGTGNTYSINDFVAGVGFGGYLTDQFSFGITGKIVRSAFSALSSSGIAFDIGTKYKTGIQGITLGFAIQNLGAEPKYSGQNLKTTINDPNQKSTPSDAELLAYSFNIPIIFRAGISSNIIEDDNNKLIAALDFVTLSDTPEQVIIGGEYTWHDFVSIRGGYRSGQDQLGLTGGVGLKYFGGGFNGEINYSINPSRNFGLVNRLSVLLSFE